MGEVGVRERCEKGEGRVMEVGWVMEGGEGRGSVRPRDGCDRL